MSVAATVRRSDMSGVGWVVLQKILSGGAKNIFPRSRANADIIQDRFGSRVGRRNGEATAEATAFNDVWKSP